MKQNAKKHANEIKQAVLMREKELKKKNPKLRHVKLWKRWKYSQRMRDDEYALELERFYNRIQQWIDVDLSMINNPVEFRSKLQKAFNAQMSFAQAETLFAIRKVVNKPIKVEKTAKKDIVKLYIYDYNEQKYKFKKEIPAKEAEKDFQIERVKLFGKRVVAMARSKATGHFVSKIEL